MTKLLRRCLRFSFAAVIAVGLVVATATVAQAITKNWTGGSGNWSPGNWSPAGVPAASDTVNIAFNDATNRTVTLNTSTPALGLLSIDNDGAGTSTLSIPTANNLTAAAISVGGYNGSAFTTGQGAMIHTNGTVTISSGVDLILAWNAGSTGTYTLNGGTLVANQTEWVGYSGTATFNHTAGTNTINASAVGSLSVGTNAGANGTYNLSGEAMLVSNESEYIGTSGTGNFVQNGGTNGITAGNHLFIGYNAGGLGTYTLNGGGLGVINGDVIVGVSATGNGGQKGGTFNHAGGNVSINASRFLYIGDDPSSTGIYTNSGGQLTAGNVVVGNLGTGTMNIQAGSVFINNALSINGSSTLNMNGGFLRFNTISGLNRLVYNGGTIQLTGSRVFGTDTDLITLYGALPSIPTGKGLILESAVDQIVKTTLQVNGGLLQTAGRLHIGDSGSNGVLNVTSNGFVSIADDLFIGPNGINSGTVVVGGTGSRINVADTLTISEGSLEVQSGGTVHVNRLEITTGVVVNLLGGTIRFNTHFFDGVFNYHSGVIQLAGPRTVGSDPVITQLFGISPTLLGGKGLAIEGTATLASSVVVNGGSFSVGGLASGAGLVLQHGTFSVTNQALTIGAGGPLGSTLDLAPDMAVNVNPGITNQGLVTGDGQIGGTFTNTATGELRGEAGKSLTLTGFANTNAGHINLLGGGVEFTQSLTNNTGALISGNGTIIARAGLTNQGTMNFAGTTNVLGDVTNYFAGGKIISGGGGATIFFDDVTNDGEIRTSTNGFTVFFGSVTGSGTFTGTGTVNFEGDLSPGSSPAAVSFAGDVAFGVDATLQIELGGTVPGTQHDKLNVTGDLALDGTLEVSLINGFNPSAGQSFNILDWGSLAGTFSSLSLPNLGGFAWNTSQLYTSGVLSVAAPGVPGDYNNDGKVDAADYVVWRKYSGTMTTLPNDPHGGTIGANQFNTWRANFGNTAGSGSGAESSNASVPEPSAAILCVFCAILLLRRWPN